MIQDRAAKDLFRRKGIKTNQIWRKTMHAGLISKRYV